MRFTVGSSTDVGRLRSLNEDGFLVVDDLVAVADGMGGHRGGEVASALALAGFEAAATVRTVDGLAAAVLAANRDVLEASRANPELAGMGTTLCAVTPLDDRHVGVVNVGDSRVYLLRSHELAQISDDHSFVESLVRDGRLTRAQADVHPQRNVLTRALGIEPDLTVDAWRVEVVDGDTLLLCSDGLFNEVPDTEIQRVLDAAADPSVAAAQLTDAANSAGGRDNITCVVVAVSEVGAPSDPAMGATAATPVVASVRKVLPVEDPDATTWDEPVVAAPAPAASPPPAPPAPTSAASADPAKPARPPRARRFSWRTALFLLAILLVFGIALGSIDVYYRGKYSVGARDGNVVVFQGPSERRLWVRPQIDRTTDIEVVDLPREEQTRVRAGIEGLTRAGADVQVDRLRRMTTTTTTTTTPPDPTPSTTPTTLPATTAAPVVPATG